jgi:hypothetical protein
MPTRIGGHRVRRQSTHYSPSRRIASTLRGGDMHRTQLRFVAVLAFDRFWCGLYVHRPSSRRRTRPAASVVPCRDPGGPRDHRGSPHRQSHLSRGRRPASCATSARRGRRRCSELGTSGRGTTTTGTSWRSIRERLAIPRSPASLQSSRRPRRALTPAPNTRPRNETAPWRSRRSPDWSTR